MATIFLSSVDGSDSDNGSTWALAKATLTGALAAISADGDIIKVDSAHSETIAADAAYTVPKRIKIVSVNRSGSDALLAGASIKTDGNKIIEMTGTGYAFYVYGMTLGLSNTTQGPAIYVNSRTGCQATYDTCTFDLNADNNGVGVYAGSENAAAQTATTLRNCTFKLYRTGQFLSCLGERTNLINCSLDVAGSAPTKFLYISGNGVLTCEGCDWSHVGSGTLVAPGGWADEGIAIFRNCKFGSGMTLLGAAIYLGYNEANHAAFAYNCASGDTHYALWHVNALGETTVSTSVYVTADGAAYDGTNRPTGAVGRSSRPLMPATTTPTSRPGSTCTTRARRRSRPTWRSCARAARPRTRMTRYGLSGHTRAPAAAPRRPSSATA